MNNIDIVKQNRIARKKLKKSIKRQAERRRHSEEIQSNLSTKINEVRSKNSDCAKLLEVAIRQILEVVNAVQFSPHTSVIDLGFVKIIRADGRFFSPTVSLPSNDVLLDMLRDRR